jgi:cell division protein FtsN
VVARRGKTQARRNSAHNGGLPGWAWLVLGIVLTVAVVLFAPKWLKSGGGDGFFRPSPNPDATPAVASAGEEAVVAEDDAPAATPPRASGKPKATQYDFYTMLPGDEVAMSDAELAATAREEAARQARAQPAATTGTTAAATPATTASMATPASPAGASDVATAVATTPADAPYILQAGAFGASGDAEATKAKVALLGLSARVESAAINGKTVYRVRMGPYATASELAEAKRKLANGGLPALAIKAK